MKTFTDDDGDKYELKAISHGFCLVPIQPKEEKQGYWVGIQQIAEKPGQYMNSNMLDLTKPQAKALAAAIEALVEYVQGPTDETGNKREETAWAAYQAMKGNK